MILATVGTQLPFPRLTDAVAAWARAKGEAATIQTGTGPGTGAERDEGGVRWRGAIPPAEFDALFREARVVVGHAGIGTILTAQRLGRPLVVMPRRADLQEHRNEHQRATARHVEGLPGIHVAWTVEDLAPLLSRDDLPPAVAGAGEGLNRLHDRIRAFLSGD